MQKSNMCKILAVGIIVLFIGVAVTPCIIGKEIPRLRIYNTCIEKSETNPNNGSLSGYVNDTFMNPIQGARVRVSFHGTFRQNYTDNSGYYHVTDIPICNCSKNCTASKEGFTTEEVWLSIYENTTYDFILNTANHPPNAPDINGPTEIPVGVEIDFIFSTLDPDGDNVSYYIKWGDGTSYGWTDYYPSGQDITIAHTWDEVDWFNIIRCKAKDTHGKESDWAKTPIRILKSKDCGCNLFSDTDLVKVERLLDKVEFYSKLLLVLSKYNPEIQGEIEELLDLINPDSLWDFPIICGILESILYNVEEMTYKYLEKAQEANNFLLSFLYLSLVVIYFNIYCIIMFIGELILGCWEFP